MGQRAMSRKRRPQAGPPAAPPLPAQRLHQRVPHNARATTPSTSNLEEPRDCTSRSHWQSPVIALAWCGAGALTRRAQGARLPPLRRPVRRGRARARARRGRRRGRTAPPARGRGAGRSRHGVSRQPAAGPAQWPPMRWPSSWTRLDGAGPITGACCSKSGASRRRRSTRSRVSPTVDPAQGLAWFRLGEMAFKQGRLDDAERAYGLARQAPAAPPFVATGVASRQVTPLAAYAQLGLARVAIERGQRDQAMRDARRRHLETTRRSAPPARCAVQLDAEAPARDAETRDCARLHAALRSAAGRRGRAVARCAICC